MRRVIIIYDDKKHHYLISYCFRWHELQNKLIFFTTSPAQWTPDIHHKINGPQYALRKGRFFNFCYTDVAKLRQKTLASLEMNTSDKANNVGSLSETT